MPRHFKGLGNPFLLYFIFYECIMCIYVYICVCICMMYCVCGVCDQRTTFRNHFAPTGGSRDQTCHQTLHNLFFTHCLNAGGPVD